MTMKDQAGAGLGDYGDVSDVANVDMFGLDEYGQPHGLGALWGAAIGGGVATAASIATRALWKSPAGFKWSEGVGFAAGAIAGGVMMAFPNSRHAGLTAIVTSFVTSGLRQIEMLLMPRAAGLGMVSIDKVPNGFFSNLPGQAGLGLTVIDPTERVGWPQQGYPQAGFGAVPSGVNLVGLGANPAELVGHAGLSHQQLANHYGAAITG